MHVGCATRGSNKARAALLRDVEAAARGRRARRAVAWGAFGLATASGLLWWASAPVDQPRPVSEGPPAGDRGRPTADETSESALWDGTAVLVAPAPTQGRQAAARTAGEPAGGPPEPPPVAVLIHHRAGSPAGRQAANRIAQEARRAGLWVACIRPEATVPAAREVRYRTGVEGDGKAAERLAARLRDRWGNAWHVRAAGRQDPECDGGGPAAIHRALEVWLPHR
jgi:hypothetical protein